ncbi:Uncharacterized protein Adt_19295 [Abeliophyllum distichum]|uniref:Transposase (putative) gypsy type domain-containing protein n=1 Tax=Abeliophyllum distichum TaxID=126358 RepID=A0ABD1SSK5_9LAMI
MSSSASHSVSPSMEDVLPIQGIDGNTGEALPIGPAPGLRKGSDPYRTEVVRWAALDLPSILVGEDLTKMREQYRIPLDVELILPGPNERACFPREGCTALHLNAFVSGMRLPLHPMLRRILRAYSLAPTQVSPNGWSQMVGGMYLWFRHSFGMEMPLHVFQTVKLPRKKGKEEEAGWLSSSVRAFKWKHRRTSVNLPGGYEEPQLQLHLEPTALPSRTWSDRLSR